PPLGDDVLKYRVGDEGEKEGVVQRRGRAELAVGPLAAGASHTVERVKILDLLRRPRAGGLPGLAREVAAGGQDDQEGDQAPSCHPGPLHDRPPSPATKSAARSGPAPAGGMWTISERSTTTAAATPNTNCEAMNQAQSTRSCSTGLTTPI